MDVEDEVDVKDADVPVDNGGANVDDEWVDDEELDDDNREEDKLEVAFEGINVGIAGLGT
jgi:hypothetical protein